MEDDDLRAIRHLNKLWKNITRNRTDSNQEAYKTQRNTCTSLRRKAIKQHFTRKQQTPKTRASSGVLSAPFCILKVSKPVTLSWKKMTGLLVTIRKLLICLMTKIADSIPEIRVEDYGEDYANHPSIKPIHEHRGAIAPSCLSFHRASETQIELYYWKRSMYTNHLVTIWSH